MNSSSGSLRRQQAELAAELRRAGKTWVEVAEVFQARFRLNPRAALRTARGWSQSRAAEEWNRRWPDHPKTLKNFSYWEIWPGKGGYSPSRDNLLRLAELYECGIADLLVDMPNFRCLDSAAAPTLAAARGAAGAATSETIPAGGTEPSLLDLFDRHAGRPAVEASAADLAEVRRQSSHVDFGELAQVIVMWIQRIPHPQTRREMLSRLAAALALAGTEVVGDFTETAERSRSPHDVSLASVASERFDTFTLAHCEAMLPSLRKQGDVLGAHVTLAGALAYRRVAQQQAKAAPAAHREHAIAVYAELTQLAGWLCFNMGDYSAAQRFYDEARTAAHEARAVELVTYVLCTMSHLATWQGKPRVGIDHAVAAAAWAEQSGSPYARAYAADVAVRALTADGQADLSRSTLDRERAALQSALTDQGPRKAWWYFYDESFYWSTSAQNALKFGGAEQVHAAVERALGLIDQSNLHNRSFRLLYRAEAFARQHNIGLACQTITDVLALTSVNSTRRIEQRIRALRTGLDQWKRTKAVKELDEAIDSYRALPSSGSGSTNAAYSL